MSMTRKSSLKRTKSIIRGERACGENGHAERKGMRSKSTRRGALPKVKGTACS